MNEWEVKEIRSTTRKDGSVVATVQWVNEYQEIVCQYYELSPPATLESESENRTHSSI